MALTTVLVRNWWALGLRGVVAVLFGVAAFVLPGVTLALLIALFGAYALIDGFLSIVAGVKAAEHHERFGSLLWRGILGIAAGLAAFVFPAITAVILTLVIAVWAIVTGVLEIVAAVHLHRAHGEWLLIINGVLSVVFGLVLVVAPGLGLLTLVWIAGGYAIFFGLIMLTLAVRLRARHVASLASTST
jgi:uncharacterized membrane protein HdeD (DUF308 family)